MTPKQAYDKLAQWRPIIVKVLLAHRHEYGSYFCLAEKCINENDSDYLKKLIFLSAQHLYSAPASGPREMGE